MIQFSLGYSLRRGFRMYALIACTRLRWWTCVIALTVGVTTAIEQLSPDRRKHGHRDDHYICPHHHHGYVQKREHAFEYLDASNLLTFTALLLLLSKGNQKAVSSSGRADGARSRGLQA